MASNPAPFANPAGNGLAILTAAVIGMQEPAMLHKRDEQILQYQKLDSIGTLAGGVAHDFNNILTVIFAACALLEKNAADSPEQMKLVSRINTYARRAETLTQSLLAFSRRKRISKQPEDLVIVVGLLQDLLGRVVGQEVLLTTYLPDDALMAMIDHGQIEQVLMIMAINARDAMPQGGTLDIVVSRVECDGAFLELEGSHARDCALITVSDSGEGIGTDVQQHIFEPFFTTKTMGNGTGLGLSIAYGIIRQHDGVIHVDSAPGEGTTFRIYLPLHEKRERTGAERITKQVPGGSETILLIEDDPEMLAVGAGLLERAGYLVLTAQDGVEALELFRYSAESIALVVLDVILPGMNGSEIHEAMKACKDDVRVLFAGTCRDDVLTRHGIDQGTKNFIPKPLDPAFFLGRVRELIDG